MSTWDCWLLEVLGPGPQVQFLRRLFHTPGKLYLPPSWLREGWVTWICMASFTLHSNHLGSTSKMFAFSIIILWSGFSICTCLDTSDVVVLDLLCSWKHCFKDLSIYPIYEAGQVSCGIWYTGPTTVSFGSLSLGHTSKYLRVLVGLK